MKKARDQPQLDDADADGEESSSSSSNDSKVAMEADDLIEYDDIVLPLFVQLNLKLDSHGEASWREASRWVKFQEDVEDGGKRWSKPFVPSIPLSAIMDLKTCFEQGILALDVEGYTIADIIGKRYNNFDELGYTK